MAARAVRWLSGVTPAQHRASTRISASGKNALTSRALEITQMSVQSPTKVTVSTRSARSSSARASPRAALPEGGLVQHLPPLGQRPQLGDQLPAAAAPDAVGHRQLFPLLGLQIRRLMGIPGKEHRLPRSSPARTRASTWGTISMASGVPSAPDTKSFCISTTTKTLIRGLLMI